MFFEKVDTVYNKIVEYVCFEVDATGNVVLGVKQHHSGTESQVQIHFQSRRKRVIKTKTPCQGRKAKTVMRRLEVEAGKERDHAKEKILLQQKANGLLLLMMELPVVACIEVELHRVNQLCSFIADRGTGLN
ncbi:hypothetical protein OIU76_030335 [Salix suchowensis]|nr:hypothetical protein OIU76_030335 [Salix suchowensis]